MRPSASPCHCLATAIARSRGRDSDSTHSGSKLSPRSTSDALAVGWMPLDSEYRTRPHLGYPGKGSATGYLGAAFRILRSTPFVNTRVFTHRHNRKARNHHHKRCAIWVRVVLRLRTPCLEPKMVAQELYIPVVNVEEPERIPICAGLLHHQQVTVSEFHDGDTGVSRIKVGGADGRPRDRHIRGRHRNPRVTGPNSRNESSRGSSLLH